MNHVCAMFMINIHVLLDGCTDDRDVIPKGLNPFQFQIEHINYLVKGNEENCVSQLRMDRLSFMKLWIRLQVVGSITNYTNVTLEEKTTMFLGVLAHHNKNRTQPFHFR